MGMAALKGLTRSTERVPWVPWGFLLGSGLLEGVYGIEMLKELVGVCDNEGAVLVVDATVDVDDRLKLGLVLCADTSVAEKVLR